MYKLFATFSIVILTIVIHRSVTAGGWPQPNGGGFAKLDLYTINAKNIFGDDGEVSGIPSYNYYSANIYAEAGITDKFTGILYFPFYVNSKSDLLIEPNEVSASNVGDLDIGGRYNFISRNKFVLSAVLILGIPTGLAEENELLWTGDGEFNQIIKAEAGFSVSNSIYAAAGVGYNNRSKGFSDELNFDIEAGIPIFEESLIVSLKSSGKVPMDNGDSDITGGYGMFSNNTGYVSIGPEISYFFKNGFGFSANTYGAFYGRNLLAAPSYSIGIVYNHRPKN